MSLASQVGAALAARGIPYALIGASALAVRGVARSTLDVDLMVVDRSALDASIYSGVMGARIDVRPGDVEDPLAGVVRFERDGEPDLDLVVARERFVSGALARAEPVETQFGVLPVVRAADLVLLKLIAGGLQDLWDVAQLLAIDTDGVVRGEVEERLEELPRDGREAWSRIPFPRG